MVTGTVRPARAGRVPRRRLKPGRHRRRRPRRRPCRCLTEARAKPRPKAPQPPDGIEPSRKRRIARDRDPIDARLDLHGMDQDQARAALHGFVDRAHAEGARAVLVITGKGVHGDGVLRRRVPEWLAEPPSRDVVAGISPGRPPPRRRGRALRGAEAGGALAPLSRRARSERPFLRCPTGLRGPRASRRPRRD